MTEKDLIKQLKQLKEIKPNKDWVLLTKCRIMPEESTNVRRSTSNILAVFQWKLAFAPIISVFIIIGLFGFANTTVPGDFLFPVKKVAEVAQVGLSLTSAEKSGVHLRLANKRLEELNAIADANKVRSLAPTIKEFQDNMTEAVNGLASADNITLRELMAETKKLEENKQKVESVLGVQIGGETDEFEEQLAGYLISDLEKRSLNEEDQKLLTEAKEYFDTGAHTLSLEKIWLLSNKPR